MRLMVYGVDRTNKRHFITELNDSYLVEISIDTKCIDDRMRLDTFKEIIIENKSIKEARQ